MTKHTGEKWTLQNASDDYGQYQIEAEGWGVIQRVEDLSNESEGNAKLHASAPELLAAVKRSENVIQIAIEWAEDVDNTDIATLLRPVSSSLRALLSRIEG
jgi:glutamine cyclotransferase